MIMFKKNGITYILITEWCNDEPFNYLNNIREYLESSYYKYNINGDIYNLKLWIDNNWSTIDRNYLNSLSRLVNEIEETKRLKEETKNVNSLNPRRQYAIGRINSTSRKILYLLPSLSEQEYNRLVEDNHE